MNCARKFKQLALILFVLVFIFTTISVTDVVTALQTQTLYVDDDYVDPVAPYFKTIQGAIDYASVGEIIYVYAGTYHEHLTIGKSLILIGEDPSTTIIDGSGTGKVVYVTADYVSISGFEITNGEVGIFLEGSSNNNISGNNILNNEYGVGIILGSDNNIIFGNRIVENNGYGIIIEVHSDNNVISGNRIFGNGGDGIRIWYYSGADISGNNITENGGDGIDVQDVSGAKISGNNIRANSGSGIRIFNSGVGKISRNNILYNGDGIHLIWASDGIISGNCIENNGYGINIGEHTHGTVISGNCITENGVGIRISLSEWLKDNVIYHNNFINNVQQAYDEAPAKNKWYHPDLLEGNYWSDYPGKDDGSGAGKHAIAGDGIGDTDVPWPGPDYDYYPFVTKLPMVETTDSLGNVKDTFWPGDNVYIKGKGYKPSTTYPLYVVNNVKWTDEMTIPSRVPGTVWSVTTDASGHIPIGTMVWPAPLVYGKYDIVIDVNCNGKYDECIDALDDLDVWGAGFFVIPELPLGTLTALLLIFAALVLFQRRPLNRIKP